MRETKMDQEIHRSETPASEDLLSWCKKITNDIYGLDVKDLTTSWKNGLAFCALIHYFRPDLIDYYKLNPEDSKVNFKTAFDAIRKLGIPSIMNSGDLMILDVPDKLSVMTVLHQVRGYFNRKERKSKGLEWDCDDMFDDFDSDGENGSLFSIALDQQLADWPSKNVNNLETIMSYASPFLPNSSDHRVNLQKDDHKNLVTTNSQPKNQHSRSTKLSTASTSKPTINSKPGEQFNGLNLPVTVKPGSKERGKESVHSLRSIDFNSQSLESSSSSSSSTTTTLSTQQSANTQQSTSTNTVQKEKKPLMTRKQLMDPFDSDSDDDKTPKGKISQRRASTSIVPTNGSTITDILDLATAEDSDPLAGINLSSPTSPDSDPSSAATSSSTTPSISTSSSSYSNNLSDNSSISCNQPINTNQQLSPPPPAQSDPPQSIHKSTVIELAPGLLDVSPKKVSPFQRGRTTPSYRSLRLDNNRKMTTPDRREKLHEKARQLIDETRRKKLTLQMTPTANLNPAPEDERRRQLREKARQMLSDQISKMIKEKSPIEPRNMEAAIRDLTLRESRKISTNQSTPMRIATIKSQSSNNNPSNIKSTKKSYVDMELMILEKEQSKIDKESAIIEEKLRLIMKNGGNSTMEEERCIRKWFTLVNKKNEILRRQMKLNILEQEKDLERCYKILIKKLQPLNSLEDWEKTDAQRETERLLLDKLLRIVEKRNELVHHLDTEEKAEAEDQMVMKETQGPLNFTPSEKQCIVS